MPTVKKSRGVARSERERDAERRLKLVLEAVGKYAREAEAAMAKMERAADELAEVMRAMGHEGDEG